MSLSVTLWNLMSEINMNAYHLRKAEVEYELRIRGLSISGRAEDLRKRLSQAFSNDVPVASAVVNSLDEEAELEECEGKFKDLAKLVGDYEGDGKDNEYSRLTGRLWHLYSRVDRIPIAASVDNDAEQQKMELGKKTKFLLDSFISRAGEISVEVSSRARAKDQKPEADRRVVEVGSQNGLAGGVRQINLLDTFSPRDQQFKRKQPEEFKQHDFLGTESPLGPQGKYLGGDNGAGQELSLIAPQYQVKTIPVYKWGIKFNSGSGQSIASFLERVEELRRARGVSYGELYESAVDLFSGPALVWYRSTVHRIKSWPELCKEMKIVFQSPGYALRLQQEIFNRTQGEKESIDMFIAAMEGLYGRLSVNVPEPVRLQQIMDNIHPHLQDRLALFDINSVEDLRVMGRKAEGGRLRAAISRQLQGNMDVLEPDLAYERPVQRRSGVSAGRVASLKSTTPGSTTGKTCWNCGLPGHRFSTCREKRKKFCYGCGQENTIKATCPRCQSKNL